MQLSYGSTSLGIVKGEWEMVKPRLVLGALYFVL